MLTISYMPISGDHQPPKLLKLNAKYLQKQENFGSSAPSRTINEIFSDTLSSSVVWQPDVYHEAALLAKRLNLNNIIDIGCGNGEKLNDIQQKHNLNTVGIDFLDSLETAESRFTNGTWINKNLQNVQATHSLIDELSNFLPAVIIFSDVIEHLIDPRPCMKLIRDLINLDQNSFLIISTPDRERQNRTNNIDLPSNRSHVREWSLNELCDFVSNFGFEISRAGWTRANQFDEYYTTIFIQAGYNKLRHSHRLATTFNAPDKWSPKHVLISSEFHGYTASGGIGSFVVEQMSNYGEEQCLVLVASEGILPNADRPIGTVVPEDICRFLETINIPLEDKVFQAIDTIFYLFPEIETVQFQEYQGIGSRVAQSKRAGMFSRELSVVVHCHGATHYLENGRRDWLSRSHMTSSICEKISIENADLVCFPSEYLRNLYQEIGLDFTRNKSEIRRYPYSATFFPGAENSLIKGIDTLIFFGKRTLMKGYGLFLDALSGESLQDFYGQGIRKIIIIGPHSTESDQWLDSFKSLSDHFEVIVYGGLVRGEAISCMSKEADRSLVIMPYIADNYPFAVFDAMSAGCLPVVVQAGGVPEMLHTEFAQILTAEANAESLRMKILDLLAMSDVKINTLRKEFAIASNERQKKINTEAAAPFVFPKNIDKISLTCAVIIPFFNTPVQQINDLFWSLAHQLHRPNEIIVINDASTQEMSFALDKQIIKWVSLGLPIRKVEHSVNCGLAAARNTALANVQSDITINIDSDDIALPNFIADIMNSFESNLDVHAVVPYLEAFNDKDNFVAGELNGYVYRPLGDGMIASQTDNRLGHANSGFRTITIKELGGWDITGRAMWEDYALFLRLVSTGKRISIVPRTGVLYRVSPKSMARSYSRWPAMRLIAKAMDGLPRFEAFRLQAAMRGYEALEQEVEKLRSFISELSHIRDSYYEPKINALNLEIDRLNGVIVDTSERLNFLWETKINYWEPLIDSQKNEIDIAQSDLTEAKRTISELENRSERVEASNVTAEVNRLNENLLDVTRRLDEVWNVKVEYFEPLVEKQAAEILELRGRIEELLLHDKNELPSKSDDI